MGFNSRDITIRQVPITDCRSITDKRHLGATPTVADVELKVEGRKEEEKSKLQFKRKTWRSGPSFLRQYLQRSHRSVSSELPYKQTTTIIQRQVHAMSRSSLASYLAKNYLNADTPEQPRKKRKKTKSKPQEESGLIIADDDPPDLRASTATSSTRRKGRFLTGDEDDDEGEEGYTIANVGGISMEPRKKKKSGWTTIQPSQVQQDNAEVEAEAEANAILASAAHEASTSANPDSDAPTIETDPKYAQRMESGALAGLQTASQTEAMMRAQRKKKAREAATAKPSTLENTTIYRDASGRIINVSMARAQARREEEEKAEQERRERDAARGDVQRREREERRAALDEARFMSLARGVDDVEMNRELKEAARWNDPAAAFLTSTTSSKDAGGTGRSGAGKKVYKGAAPPNRYGIRPGHRWDGVDRSTGFEKRWFEARNKRERVGMLEYAWQMDE